MAFVSHPGILYIKASDDPADSWTEIGELAGFSLSPKQTQELFLTAFFYAFMYRN